MKNGLYKVAFHTQLGRGTGIIVLRDGKVSGGDASMYYSGTYNTYGGNFSSEIRVAKHTDVSGVQSVLGVDYANLNLTGSSTDDVFTATPSMGC